MIPRGGGRRRVPELPYTMPTSSPWGVPSYCVTPTPDSTGSGLHPSVVDFKQINNGRWKGYRYWMAFTPYYMANSDLENPCVLASMDGMHWIEPRTGMNPLYPMPGAGLWNSDTELAYDSDADELVMLFRGGDFQPKVARTSDGVTWPESPTDANHWPVVTEEQTSPCLLHLSSGKWVAWTAQYPTMRLNMWMADVPEGPWSGPLTSQSAWTRDSTSFWHMAIKERNGTFYMLAAQPWDHGASLFTASSSDGVAWTRSAGVLLAPTASTWYPDELYRSTFTFHENGTHVRMWYSGRSQSDSVSWRIGYTQVPLSEWPTP